MESRADSSALGFPNSWANIVPCEMNGNGQWQWWCGHWDQTEWCTAGKNASLLTYPRGNIAKILGVTDVNTTNTTSTQSCPSAVVNSSLSNEGGHSVNSSAVNASRLGIGLGIGLPLLLTVVALAVMLFRERKRTKNLRETLAQQPQYLPEEKGYYVGGEHGPGELATNYVYELGESGRTPELDTRRATMRQELARKSVNP
jgi:hypothetical protein